jgi:predicted transcriptional regulator
MDDFARIALLGSCLSREYAPEVFRLLATYRTLSASEVASRTNLHIQTAQTFLETLTTLGVLEKQEATDKTRPYFRYHLKVDRVSLEVDFKTMAAPRKKEQLERRVRERRSSGTRFVAARGRNAVSMVVAWVGTGRQRQERRLNLTPAQGAFLFYLPFPSDAPRSIAQIMVEASLDETCAREVLDLVDRLDTFGGIEFVGD